MKRSTVLSRVLQLSATAAPKQQLLAAALHTTPVQYNDKFESDDYTPSSKFEETNRSDDLHEDDFLQDDKEGSFSDFLSRKVDEGNADDAWNFDETENAEMQAPVPPKEPEPEPFSGPEPSVANRTLLTEQEFEDYFTSLFIIDDIKPPSFFQPKWQAPLVLLRAPLPEHELEADIFRTLMEIRNDPEVQPLVTFLGHKAEFNPLRTWVNTLMKFRKDELQRKQQASNAALAAEMRDMGKSDNFEKRAEEMWQFEREQRWCNDVLRPYAHKLRSALRQRNKDTRKKYLTALYDEYGAVESPFDFYVSTFFGATPRFDIPRVSLKNKLSRKALRRGHQHYLSIVTKWRRESLPREIQSYMMNRFCQLMGLPPVKPIAPLSTPKPKSTEVKEQFKQPTQRVEQYLLERLFHYEFFPSYIDAFDEVRVYDPDMAKLEDILSKWSIAYSRLTADSKPQEGDNDKYMKIFDAMYAGEATEEDVKEYKRLRYEARQLRDALVLKIRVKALAKEFGIELPRVISVQSLEKRAKPSKVDKTESEEKEEPEFDMSFLDTVHLVSYVDENGRKVTFEVPKTDVVKTFRQNPNRAPTIENRRGWKGRDYALEQVTDPEALRIREHFKYQRDFKYRKFPFDLGPRVMDEWKVYERHLKRKLQRIEDPNFDDSLQMRKGALLNRTVDMTLNHAIELCEDAWRKRYVPTEKSDKFTKALTCIVDYWKELNSRNPEEERRNKVMQAKGRFKQYMYRQLLTQFVKEAINQNMETLQNSKSPLAKDLAKLDRMVNRLLSQLDAAGGNTEAIRSAVHAASHHHMEPTWFGTQLAHLREMIEHLDSIIDVQVSITEDEDIEAQTEHLRDQAAVCEFYLANTGSLMYLHGARLSDVRTAYDMHRIIKNSTNIQEAQKRQVRELFRFCFQEFELFTKPTKTQVFDQF